ncbi:MAG: choice-of-anchor tandem repeat GloVer-containing protein [Terriglobales bacterium]
MAIQNPVKFSATKSCIGGRHWVAAAVLIAAITIAPAHGASSYTVLHNFADGQDGGSPQGTLVLNPKGVIYGACDGGGAKALGTAFQLVDHGGNLWEETVIYNFGHYTSGDGVNGSLALDGSGNLFGTTTDGGPHDVGTLYELSPRAHGWDLNVLYEYGTDTGVILDKAGNIYGYFGPGDYGGGAISELVHASNGWSLKTLYSFCDPNCGYGEGPLAPLSWDAAGNLYGTTYFGGNGPPNCPGSLGCGVAFQMTRNSDSSWKYHVLHRFAAFPTDGQSPYGGLTVDGKGNVYGTTTHGGKYDNGTVFELTPVAGGRWKQTVLYDFPSVYLGGAPGSNLLFDKAGNLYGTAGGGNLSCPETCGVIFKLTSQAPGKWKYSLVHKFDGSDGDTPNGLTMDGAGNLYGTTEYGGQYNYGVAFEIKP